MAKKKQYPTSRYYQITDGEWVVIPWKGFKDQCCSCGLVHKTDYRVRPDGALEFKCSVDNRATAAVRRAFKFEKET